MIDNKIMELLKLKKTLIDNYDLAVLYQIVLIEPRNILETEQLCLIFSWLLKNNLRYEDKIIVKDDYFLVLHIGNFDDINKVINRIKYLFAIYDIKFKANLNIQVIDLKKIK